MLAVGGPGLGAPTLYVRVSVSSENPRNQELAISRWAGENWFRIIEWFIDHGVSGAVPPSRRPEYKRLLETVERDPHPVLVYELSRVGRSFYEVLRAVQELEMLGAPVITVSPKESSLSAARPSDQEAHHSCDSVGC